MNWIILTIILGFGPGEKIKNKYEISKSQKAVKISNINYISNTKSIMEDEVLNGFSSEFKYDYWHSHTRGLSYCKFRYIKRFYYFVGSCNELVDEINRNLK